jgi:hypothetical protein
LSRSAHQIRQDQPCVGDEPEVAVAACGVVHAALSSPGGWRAARR